MATKLKPIDSTNTDADVATYFSLLSELDASLKAEHAAHKRLVKLVRKVEAEGEQRAALAR